MVIPLTRLMRTYRTIIRPNHLHIYISRSYSELLPEVDDSITNLLNHRIKILIKNNTLDDARMIFDKSEDKNTVTWNLMLNGYVKGNDIVKGRQLFDEMPERDSVSWNTLISGYLSCKCLEEGRVLFNEMPCRDIVSWNTMISGYAENKRMDEAWKLFDQAPSRNVVTWNAMIMGFLQNGDLRNAFGFFREMPEQNVACLSALVCALVQKGELDEAQKILLESSCKNDDRDDMVHAYNTLIGGYGRRGRIEDARRLFDLIPYYHDERPAKFKRNVVSWNTMIMCYVKAKDVCSARVLFDKMKERDTLTWNTMIDGYIKMSKMEAASYLFDKMPNPSVYTYNSLISGFSCMGKVDEARKFLERMPARDQVSWNLVLSGYVRQGEIVKARQMFDEGVDKDVVSWNTMISGYVCCRNLEEGRKLFDLMPCRDTFSWNTMISGYAKIGRMNEAWKLFDQMPNRNVVSWNAMVSGYLQNGDFRSAIRFFKKMPERDAASLSALVAGLVQNGKLDKAGTILLEISCENDDRLDLVHAYNTLIAGYGRIGRIEDARRLFDRIPCGDNQMRSDRFKRNLVSWNIMIMSYVKAKDVLSARTLFDQMTERDTYSWNTMINGYIETCDIEEAYSLIVKMPNPDVYTWNSLLSGYSQMSELEKARELFERMPQRNRVSWNTIIAAYDKNKQYREAIELFINMQLEGEKPDRHTLSSLLSACAEIADIHLGIQIHQQVTKFFTPDVPLNNSLITMYARCGAIMEARTIFEEMKLCKDVISWNAMIGGYALHGYATKALELFASMKEVSLKPTYITFISVLNACANAGLAEEGRLHFNSMVNEFGLKPRVEHYATLVDIVGRNGQLEEAMDVIKGMVVEPDKAVWGALLGACKVHNNIKLARVAAEALIRLEPESSTAYVLLHNMYADIGQWEDATEIRMLMEKHNIRKSAGYSLVDSISHDFNTSNEAVTEF